MPKLTQPPAIPGYTYVRGIGTGGFADVYLYRQNTPQRDVAIKVLHADKQAAASPDGATYFNAMFAEGDIMAGLSRHPSIVEIYDLGISQDGRPYFTMERCFESLDSVVKQKQPLSVQEVLTIGVGVASALETAHRAGVFHRDVKPANLLKNSYGKVLLGDFGVAVLAKDVETSALALSVPWTAPEIVAKESGGSPAADVWSLAATLYALLAGRSPVDNPAAAKNTTDERRGRVLKGSYFPLARPDVPAQLEQFLLRALSRDPAQRPQTALEFAQGLQYFENQLRGSATPLELESVANATAVYADTDFARTLPQTPITVNSVNPARAAAREKYRQPAAASTQPANLPRNRKTVKTKQNRKVWLYLLIAVLAAGGGALAAILLLGGQ